MSQHIGIVACSSVGAALCYTTICTESARRLGSYAHPEVTLHSVSFEDYMRHIDAGEWEAIAGMMLLSEGRVAQAGADFAICPDNTIHEAFDFVREKAQLPWLHIADEVGAEAMRQGYRKVGVLGTKYLMEGPVYPKSLSARGIDYDIPATADRQTVNRVIFEELVHDRFPEPSRDEFCRIIEGMKHDGCDAVVLGCTEIPLLVTPDVSPLPVLDSTRILARAAVERALG